MKNRFKIFGMIALIAVIGFALVGCEQPTSNGRKEDLSGSITITPSENVTTGTELTALYTGDEDVAYQWQVDGFNLVGSYSKTCSTYSSGEYTVTVSADGYNSKTSDPVTVIHLNDLSGSIRIIYPDGGFVVGMELTADYYTFYGEGEEEDIVYQWQRDGNNVGTDSEKYIVEEEGVYTVTVSSEGYKSKTSSPIPLYSDSSYYIEFDKSTGTVTGYNSSLGPKDVIIPDTIDGIPVAIIKESAFYDDGLTSVTIGNSVTTIGSGAFLRNNLTSVTIGNSVTTIGEFAFSGSGSIVHNKNKITSVTIGNSVTTIGENAFSDNELTSITIPDSVTAIGSSAFSNNKLTSVIIPDSVTTIGSGAFSGNWLTSVIIPDSITTIASWVFADNSLTSITIPDSVRSIGASAFVCDDDRGYNSAILSITIGSDVELGNTVSGEAFSDRFVSIYNDGGKLKGTYTRSSRRYSDWKKQ